MTNQKMKKFISCVLLCIFFLGGCVQQLLQIPIQLIGVVLSVPFKVIKMAGDVAPLAAKYAPVAMMFADANLDVCSDARLSELLQTTFAEAVVFFKENELYGNCYVFNFEKEKLSSDSIFSFMQCVDKIKGSRVLFSDEFTVHDKHMIDSYHDELRRQGASIAYLQRSSSCVNV